jgi:hypothetical protein
VPRQVRGRAGAVPVDGKAQHRLAVGASTSSGRPTALPRSRNSNPAGDDSTSARSSPLGTSSGATLDSTSPEMSRGSGLLQSPGGLEPPAGARPRRLAICQLFEVVENERNSRFSERGLDGLGCVEVCGLTDAQFSSDLRGGPEVGRLCRPDRRSTPRPLGFAADRTAPEPASSSLIPGPSRVTTRAPLASSDSRARSSRSRPISGVNAVPTYDVTRRSLAMPIGLGSIPEMRSPLRSCPMSRSLLDRILIARRPPRTAKRRRNEMFENVKSHRVARLLAAVVTSGALLALAVGEVFAGWGRGG